MTLSWINSLCVTLSEKCHESLQAMISSMVATLFTEKARALNLSSYIDVCTTVRTLWKTYNVYDLNLRQLYFLHINVQIYVHCWERRWYGCQKFIFIQNQVWPRRPSVSLHPPLDSTTTPGLRLHLGNIFWKSCLLHKFAQKTYLHIARAQCACLVPYSGHSEARQATRMIVQIHFSYTLCQTKPNCLDLWDLNVVGLLVLVTLHTVSPCVLLCLVHTHSQQVPVSTKELISLQYIAKVSFKCRLAE